MDISDIVKKLIGNIKPIGESNADNENFENLKKLCKLTKNLLHEIDNVSTSFSNNKEYSIKRSCKYANDFLVEVGFKPNLPQENGGIDLYFKDLAIWEESLYCNECGNDTRSNKFYYARTVANGVCYYCSDCKLEKLVGDKPNEDNY